MSDNISNEDCEKLFIDCMKLFSDKGLPINVIYYLTGSMFCRIAQVIERPLDQIIEDFKATFNSLPAPIIEDENVQPHQ